MAWNQASRKYNLALSLGCFIMRAAGMVLKVLNKLARIPGGGSNTKIRPARSKFTGTFGFISIVRKSLKLACGCSECNFFSSCTSHCGAKCTFFSNTQRPDFTAMLIARSAWLKPSAEPGNNCIYIRNMWANVKCSKKISWFSIIIIIIILILFLCPNEK